MKLFNKKKLMAVFLILYNKISDDSIHMINTSSLEDL